jgi:hypothetical protein
MGSRYGGLKQIDPVGQHGEAVLDYSVHDALAAGFKKIVFIIRHDIEQAFRAAIGARFESRADVRYVFQELSRLPAGFQLPLERQKPWGTGHALLCAADELHEPFAAINADDFYGPKSYQIMADFLRSLEVGRAYSRADSELCSQSPPASTKQKSNPTAAPLPTYAMIGFTLSTTLSEHGTVARGLCKTDPNGFLTSVEELTALEKTPTGARNKPADGPALELTGREIVSMNFWGFTPEIIPQMESLFIEFLERSRTNPKSEFYIPTAVNLLVERRQARVKVLPTPESWFGVTYKEDKQLVMDKIAALTKRGTYAAPLWSR